MTWLDSAIVLSQFLGAPPHEPGSGSCVILNARRWVKEIALRDGWSGSAVRLEMRSFFRSLPYDDSEDSINRRLIRDTGGRPWYVVMLDDPARLIAEAAPYNGRERS